MSLLIFNKKNKSLMPVITEIFIAPDDFLGMTPKLRAKDLKTADLKNKIATQKASIKKPRTKKRR